MTIGLGRNGGGVPLLRLIRPGCYEHWCAGCGEPHRLEIEARMPSGERVGFDGDIYRPSFEPEIVHEYGERLCRYVLRGGWLHFADDCTHTLAGQSVELPDFPN